MVTRRRGGHSPKVIAVARTGAGKTLIFQAAGTLLGGIVVVITPLILLNQDHLRKFLSVNDDYGNIEAFHLDEPCLTRLNSREQVKLVDHLKTIDKTSHSGIDKHTVFLFVSPEKLIDNALTWNSLLTKDLYCAGALGLIVIDEPQMIISHGLGFRPKILCLYRDFFSKIMLQRDLMRSIPLCCIITTLPAEEQWLFEKLLHVNFLPKDIVMSTSDEMEKRTTNISIRYGDLLPTAYASLVKMLCQYKESCAIVYTNTHITLKILQDC